MLKNLSMEYINIQGTIRAYDVHQTLAKLTPLLNNFGITRIANVTGLDRLGIPVALCIRPNSKHLSVSQGKGLTWELAKISSIMESIEGYHIENPPPAILKGSYYQLNKEHSLIDPNKFAEGYCITDRCSLCLEWIQGMDWIEKKKIFVPRILACLDSTVPRPEYIFFNVSSNGLAAGNILEEALLHSLCEVIERDSLIKFDKLTEDHKTRKQIDLSTIDHKKIQELLCYIKNTELNIRIWDITSNLEIATYLCEIKDSNKSIKIRNFYGSGTHLLKEIAMIRAITEAAQSRLTVISGSRDDIFPSYYNQNTTSNNEIKNGSLSFAKQQSNYNVASFSEGNDLIIQKLKKKGFNKIFVVDHTKKEFLIPVVQVFVLGLKFSGMS